ncbi:unnamed protein product [Bemisia tabaci]|uniref:Replication termination factor 2 n=1 Tax=Bemisia tabaci TaxID=7038 RepID=A0A9P0A8V9_BEMTA|nr:unnamed protein product [Bemisia tabaci]
MGCDGGTIPKRDELVKTKKKPEQKDKASELSFRWCHCSITQQPLQKPIVACGLGRLYSKISILEALLDRTLLPDTARHVKSIKDVKELKLTPNPSFSAKAEKGDGYVDRQCSEYICPTIGLEMNGKFKFCFLWTCGCVMSERALKQIKDKNCLQCQKPFTADDVVILNASDEDLTRMSDRLETRQARLKAEKKDKKLKLKEGMGDASTSQNGKKPVATTSHPNDPKDAKSDQAKVGEKRATSIKELVDPAFKKAKSEYSVSKDPNATDVYKSLFTTSSKAQNQTKAHWITYNPFYN